MKTSTALLTLLALAALSSSPLLAQSVPYRARGQNASYFPGPPGAITTYEGSGVGTHVGRHDIEGELLITSGSFNPEPGVFFRGTFEGVQEITAANGDVIKCSLSGDVQLNYVFVGGIPVAVEGRWEPKFKIIPGSTGRFGNATGAFSGVAINPPFDPNVSPWPFNWEIAGRIDLGKKGKKK